MKSIKYLLPLVILFLSIGYAATNISLSVKGNIEVASDIDDFDVYISNISIDGVTNINLLVDNLSFEYTLPYDAEKVSQGITQTISYEITNNSTTFDANVEVVCTEENSEIDGTTISAITNLNNSNSDESTIISKESIVGETILGIHNPIAKEELIFTCEIIAEPIEKNEIIEGSTPGALNPLKIRYTDSDKGGYINIGDLVNISGEKFNIISADDENVVLLAQYNIDQTTNKQSTTTYPAKFAENNGWDNTALPQEIDFQTWGGTSKTILNNYVSKISSLLNDNTVSGDLITIEKLGKLGCTITADYTWSGTETCADSSNKWLLNNQHWWTKSASMYPDGVWGVGATGILGNFTYSNETDIGVRPTITINYELFKELSETNKNSMIVFNIRGRAFRVETGTTWGEFVYSNNNPTTTKCHTEQDGSNYCYTTRSFETSGNNILYTNYDALIKENNGQEVLTSDIIKGNTTYIY